MILTKYILKEIFKNQLSILILLFLVCIFQKIIKVFGLENNISIYLIFLYLIFNLPELGKLIIPFSLFLSIIITFYRLHMHNEILAMFSCSIKKSFFIKTILSYSFIISYLSFINMSWISPYCEQHKNNILFEIKKNSYHKQFIEKKFQFFTDKKIVLFMDKIHNSTLQNIFIIKKRKNKDTNTLGVIIADQGVLYYQNNCIQSITLKTGTYYEIPYNQTIHSNIFLTNFSQYQILIDYYSNPSYKTYDTINKMSMNQLWKTSTIETRIELSWRLTLLISIFILPLIALALTINISSNYLLNFLLSIVLYTSFFLSQILLRSYATLHYLNAIIWIWSINFIYFIIYILINVWKNLKFKIFLKKLFMFL